MELLNAVKTTQLNQKIRSLVSSKRKTSGNSRALRQNVARYESIKTEQLFALRDLQRKLKLSEKVRESQSFIKFSQLVCSLIFDEMYIRKQVFLCNQTQQYLEYVTYGNKGDTLEIATQALVFMLSDINQYFEFPLAYHFISSLNATEKANLLTEIIEKITEQDVRVINVTFDGYASNGPMCEK